MIAVRAATIAAFAAWPQETRPEAIESPLPGGVAEAVRFMFSAVPQWLQIGGAAIGVVVAGWLVWYGWRRRYDIWGWLWERPAWVQAAIGLLLVGFLSGAGWFGQRAWDYTQHSNAFCTACHVMAEPFRQFQRSAHSGLQCHDCHRQSVFASMRQVYLWVADRPSDIGEHAPVPNGVCSGCHVEGDPERWRQIERSAGHRVHLASDSLQGLQCVECHGASVHQFTPSKATCGQSGCHTEVDIGLGGMSDLTVHCVACHDFARPTGGRLAAAPSADTLFASAARDTAEGGLLRPERRQCLSCHAMRSMLTDFPADDPHEAECAACHNPHGETEQARAPASCTEGGCHTPLDTAVNRHHRLEAEVVGDCTDCHSPHGFGVRGESCLECHREIFRSSSVRVPGQEPAPGRAADGGDRPSAPVPLPGGHPGSTGADSRGPADPTLAGPGLPGRARAREAGGDRSRSPSPPGSAGAEAIQDTTPFTHEDHRDMDCLACHQSGRAAVPEAEQWCASCHHEETATRACSSCHRREALRSYTAQVERTLRFSVGDPRTRALTFSHVPHDTLACTGCHTGRPLLSASDVSCSECHEEHHSTDAACVACHERAPADAHPVEVHLTCSGSGCHDPSELPARATSRRRNVCQACHQEQVDHRPDQECVHCHVLPEAREPSTTAADRGPTAVGRSIERGGGE